MVCLGFFGVVLGGCCLGFFVRLLRMLKGTIKHLDSFNELFLSLFFNLYLSSSPLPLSHFCVCQTLGIRNSVALFWHISVH